MKINQSKQFSSPKQWMALFLIGALTGSIAHAERLIVIPNGQGGSITLHADQAPPAIPFGGGAATVPLVLTEPSGDQISIGGPSESDFSNLNLKIDPQGLASQIAIFEAFESYLAANNLTTGSDPYPALDTFYKNPLPTDGSFDAAIHSTNLVKLLNGASIAASGLDNISDLSPFLGGLTNIGLEVGSVLGTLATENGAVKTLASYLPDAARVARFTIAGVERLEIAGLLMLPAMTALDLLQLEIDDPKRFENFKHNASSEAIVIGVQSLGAFSLGLLDTSAAVAFSSAAGSIGTASAALGALEVATFAATYYASSYVIEHVVDPFFLAKTNESFTARLAKPFALVIEFFNPPQAVSYGPRMFGIDPETDSPGSLFNKITNASRAISNATAQANLKDDGINFNSSVTEILAAAEALLPNAAGLVDSFTTPDPFTGLLQSANFDPGDSFRTNVFEQVNFTLGDNYLLQASPIDFSSYRFDLAQSAFTSNSSVISDFDSVFGTTSGDNSIAGLDQEYWGGINLSETYQSLLATNPFAGTPSSFSPLVSFFQPIVAPQLSNTSAQSLYDEFHFNFDNTQAAYDFILGENGGNDPYLPYAEFDTDYSYAADYGDSSDGGGE